MSSVNLEHIVHDAETKTAKQTASESTEQCAAMINGERQDTNIQRNSSSQEGSRSQEIMCTSWAESRYTDYSNEVLAKAVGSGAHS